MHDYVIITESALDVALIGAGFSDDEFLPNPVKGIHKFQISENIEGYRVAAEPETPYVALIRKACLNKLKDTGCRPEEPYRRVARVVKGLKSPPIHLPRQWAEYHYKNFLAFFASSRDTSNMRWVAEIDSHLNCVLFDMLASSRSEGDFERYSPAEWPNSIESLLETFFAHKFDPGHFSDTSFDEASTLAAEVDLEAIGSGSVVNNRTYEEWDRLLTPRQKNILENPINASVRVVGPAGSGKTLALCMRAIQISRDAGVASQGKKVLIATHSWAMAERIDGVLNVLNGGMPPAGVITFPLLSLLELHAGHIGLQRTDVIGDDSSDGRLKSLEIIKHILASPSRLPQSGVSSWISEALRMSEDSRVRLELIINIYDEISGVLTASGVSPDDPESIRQYVTAKREDWMPPFLTAADRGFIMTVYREFIQELIDRSAITTDQFILDSIRVLETFTWRMRKETDGYDYILVDELQLFDPQERSALELLGRAKQGVPFVTAEDPSQSVFSALNTRSRVAQNEPIYLDTVHRFNIEIFDLISFIYQKFPLNTLPLKIEQTKDAGPGRPHLYSCMNDRSAIDKAAELAESVSRVSAQSDRICLATLGDVDGDLAEELERRRLFVTRLEGFDDVEQLAYSKRSIIVAPWQFVGGTQFSHVIVVAAAISSPSSQFARLRELIAVYLSCSRASQSLNIVCSNYMPAVLWEAKDHKLLVHEEL